VAITCLQLRFLRIGGHDEQTEAEAQRSRRRHLQFQSKRILLSRKSLNTGSRTPDCQPTTQIGTPLPPLEKSRDTGEFVPLWKQDVRALANNFSASKWLTNRYQVRDEKGRRRLHGAFTGGFSAGYFNTVGSKEGMYSYVIHQLHAQLSTRMDAVDLQVIACGSSQTENCKAGGFYGR